MAHEENHICLYRFSFIYVMNDLWEDAYTCPIYAALLPCMLRFIGNWRFDNLQRWSGMYKLPLTSRDFIGLWKEKRYRRNMIFLFAGHFVCTVFLLFTLWMTCERTLIHAQFTLWIAPQNLQFTLWNSRLWDEYLQDNTKTQSASLK